VLASQLVQVLVLQLVQALQLAQLVQVLQLAPHLQPLALVELHHVARQQLGHL
jgi:hypothetical protein